MPSPTWCNPAEPLVSAAITAAIHHAWEHPAPERTRALHDTLRRILSAEMYEQVQTLAHSLYLLQPDPPDGLEIPPSWAWFTACPRCMLLKKTKYNVPQNGRVKLQVLRDPDWCARQLELGRGTTQIAKRLDCSAALVTDWLRKHSIQTPKTLRHEHIEETVRRMHADREGPGAIAKALGHGMTADRVREVLRRLGLANKMNGQVYFEREWWRVRLEDQGKTQLACSREAGIRPHAGSYWTNRFGLKSRHKKRTTKYPILADPPSLRELLFRHGGNYDAAAREVGCAASLVSRYARAVLGMEKRHENHLPHSDREWWEERLDRGLTTDEMAEEAGVLEKTARERLRRFGLLPKGYANKMERERARRKGAAA